MARSIVYQSEMVAGTEKSAARSGVADQYKDKLLKLIPAEIVAAYLTLKSLLDSAGDANTTVLQWVVFGGLLVLTPVVYYRIYGVKEAKQLVVTTLAFLVWAFVIGSPLDSFFMDVTGTIAPIKGILASVILVFYSLTAPVILKDS